MEGSREGISASFYIGISIGRLLFFNKEKYKKSVVLVES
jgi:hypothetical protein